MSGMHCRKNLAGYSIDSDMRISPVFDETYKKYLSEIATIDFLGKAELLGLTRHGNFLGIPLYDQRYTISEDGISSLSGDDVTPAVRVILSKYLLYCTHYESTKDDPYKTFRDFRDASPLISYFTANTNKTLESTFAGKLTELRNVCQAIGGVEQENPSYDCSMLFYALPRIPVVLNFNDRDELFPASCSVLYRASAEQFLDMECLAMTGTLLSGKLISSL